jgi:hypothetical protein
MEPWIIVMLALSLIAPVVVLALVGSVTLFVCCRVGGVPRLTFGRSCKTYLLAAAYGLMLLKACDWLSPTADRLLVQALVSTATQLVVVLLALRVFSARALIWQGTGVLMTNFVLFAVLVPLCKG